MTPDKERFLKNIRALAKDKRIRLGDLESSCGVSVGYLARFAQDKSQNLPGTDFLIRAMEKLNVSLDFLLFFDYFQASETDKYYAVFIDQLVADTIKEKLFWHTDPGCFPVPFVSGKSQPLPDHPLLGSRNTYLSSFHPSLENLAPRAAWRASISDTMDVLLVKVIRESDKDASEESIPWEELELYMYDKKEKALAALCHTNMCSQGFLDGSLKTLAETIEDMFQGRELEPWSRSAIDAYLSGR